MLTESESNLVLEGGTHNPMAPPVDFLAKAYLPLVNRLGPQLNVQLVRPGFYPVGGGEFTVRVRPAKQLGRLELLDRGRITARRVRVLVANLPRHIAERECRTIAHETGWDESSFTIDEVKSSLGPGNATLACCRKTLSICTGDPSAASPWQHVFPSMAAAQRPS